MARPRVFLSSTFYDLKYIRQDLENFVKQLGYEPVMNERGTITYEKDVPLEESCYKEIPLCDIMVHIIGGRFGTKSGIDNASISQHELKAAIQADKPVFIFVEKGVHTEHVFYKANKDRKDVNFPMVDDVRIHQFLDEVAALPRNNPTQAFESSQDITAFLREQWAGLFQRYLSNLGKQRDVDAVQSLQQTAKAFDDLVALMREMFKDKDAAISDLVLTNHPIFERLRTMLEVPYRVFFTTRAEMTTWLGQRSYVKVRSDGTHDHFRYRPSRSKTTSGSLLRIKKDLFDTDGRLLPINRVEWQDDAVTMSRATGPRSLYRLKLGGLVAPTGATQVVDSVPASDPGSKADPDPSR